MLGDRLIFNFAVRTCINYWESLSKEDKFELMKKASNLPNPTAIKEFNVIPDVVFQYLMGNPQEIYDKKGS